MSTSMLKTARIALLGLIVVATLIPPFATPVKPVEAQTSERNATTYDAGNITQTSATLYGSATFQPQQEWFEIGTTQDLGGSKNASNGFGTASNLQPGTTYYYRYVAIADGITCYGNVVQFTTLPAQNQPPAQCSASLSWNANAVNAGGSATETWSVQGAQSVTGYCTGNAAGLPQAEHNISTGPQSYTFTNIQSPVTCTVRGFINSQESCRASATVNVNVATFTATASASAFASATCPDGTTATASASATATATSNISIDDARQKAQTEAQGQADAQARANAQVKCGSTPTPTPQVCNDPAALNYRGPLPCQYRVQPQVCQDPNAINYLGTLPCQYRVQPQVCTDPNALNYGGALPCQYPQPVQRCMDPAASNYLGTLPCLYPAPVCSTAAEQPTATTLPATGATSMYSAQLNGTVSSNSNSYFFEYGTTQSLGRTTPTSYPAGGTATAYISGLQPSTTYYFRVVAQNACNTARGQILSFTTPGPSVCNDPSALNYGGSLPCQYQPPIPTCQDPSATNYGGALPCQYTPRCQDPSAINYGQIGTCQYQQRCQDPSASNYGQIGTCQYQQRCTDPSAINYNQIGTCQYQQRCTDPSAINYNQIGTCQYTQRCNDPSATNYGQTGTCYYQQRCTDTSALNYNQIGTCQYPQLQRCQDTNALNYLGTLPCQYRVNQCTVGPTATISTVTNLGTTYATLNGYINTNGSITNYWFTYGSGQQTVTQYLGTSSGNVSAYISGLQANKTYVYTLVAQSNCGTNYSQVGYFTTRSDITTVVGEPPTVISQPPVITVTGIVGGASCLVLTPTIQPNNPLPGQEFVYGITYRNDCPFDLRSASMRIYLPNEIDFSSTNYPFLTRDLNVITYNLGTIPRNFQNTILVRGLVKATIMAGSNLIFKSDLSFADSRGRIQTVSAFLTAIVAGVAQGAATVATGIASVWATLVGFLASGWFWFLLFLLLLALFILWLATRSHQEPDLVH